MVRERESNNTFTFDNKSFSPFFPLLLCSSTPSSPSILRPRPPLLAVCKSSHLKLLPWATSWPPIGGEAAEFPPNRWCLDQLQKSKSTSSLGWEDCIDGVHPPHRCWCLDWWPLGQQLHNLLAPPPHYLTVPPAFDVFGRDPPSFGPTPYFDSAHVKRPESEKVKTFQRFQTKLSGNSE